MSPLGLLLQLESSSYVARSFSSTFAPSPVSDGCSLSSFPMVVVVVDVVIKRDGEHNGHGKKGKELGID
ncbi:hypothetical protein L6452_06706 [Arctium lappa]|uniref:Uncharacterized protein n=1 Tax=Arctium lappa TaxID=4217 RepID=A0ACB9EKZ4_ARCLA|nr:hypothetical protein L6452_06706 [Arctium lappa]